jgi:hypothetical protein
MSQDDHVLRVYVGFDTLTPARGHPPRVVQFGNSGSSSPLRTCEGPRGGAESLSMPTWVG